MAVRVLVWEMSRGWMTMGWVAVEISVLSGTLVLRTASSPGQASENHLRGFLRILNSGCPSSIWWIKIFSRELKTLIFFKLLGRFYWARRWNDNRIGELLQSHHWLCGREDKLCCLSSSAPRRRATPPRPPSPDSFPLKNPHSLERNWTQNWVLNGCLFYCLLSFQRIYWDYSKHWHQICFQEKVTSKEGSRYLL